MDVEECSDNDADSASPLGNAISRASPPSSTLSASNTSKDEDVDAEAVADAKKRRKEERAAARIMKPKCNSEELASVECFLETKELWDKFNELGTEMIITKTGR